MRIVIAVLVPLFLLAACGNEEEIAAKTTQFKATAAALQRLEAELAEKSKEWQPIKDAFIAANQRLRGALMGGSKEAAAAAQDAYDKARVEDKKVTTQERELRKRIRQLKDKMEKLQAAVKKLGGGTLKP